MKPLIIRGFFKDSMLHEAKRVIDDCERFDEYQNVFESKMQVPKEYHANLALRDLIDEMFSPDLIAHLKVHFGLSALEGLRRPADDYFTAFFVYVKGDYLRRHFDPAIRNGQRKIIGANLYLNRCEGGEFSVNGYDIQPEFNTLVAFTNDIDGAHAVKPIKHGQRLILTTGYVVDDLEYGPMFSNRNRRAIFIPDHGENWTQEKYELAAKRSWVKM